MRILLVVLLLLVTPVLQAAIGQERATSSGTGFFINEAGWLVTNYHVIEGCSRVQVIGYGDAISVANDRAHDLALIKVSAVRTISPVTFSFSVPRLGEEVVAVGYPLYPLLSPDPKVTTGNINSLTPVSGEKHLLQHSSPIQPGNSGGPLMNMAGQVVGVNVSQLSNSEFQNVNFAIRPEFVARFITSQGLSFQQSPVGQKMQSVADVAEIGAKAAVLIVCFGGSQPEHNEPSADAPHNDGLPADWYLAVYPRLDFWGADLLPKGVETETVGQCAAECANEPQCRVFTYNTSQKRCFLKKRVDISILSDGALSGVFLPSSDGRAPDAEPIVAEFVMRESASYSFINNPFSQPSRAVRTLDACLRNCKANGSCSFTTFTFGKAAPCRSWSAIPGNLIRNTRSVSFDKIYQPVSPAEVFPLN